ncbi:unnamed protein product [Arctia plantaginis]|uniref:Uncharacterized protein n=1 Tax=Arctia plantaginis TaxID=874455 RepID=A0A8S0YQW1_ARCPL|nr:unnamed protein product [Arctia plantaginis]
MVTRNFIAALFVIVVEFRVAKLEPVDIKLGRRNVIIPQNGHVKVKRFKPEEFEHLKMNIPDLVELVAKVQGRPPPPGQAMAPPRHPLPPDPYQPAPQYEPHYPNPSYRRHPQHQVPNYSEAHLIRNYRYQPPINPHFSEFPKQENHSEQMLLRQYHPLPYYEYTQPINRPEEAVRGGTQYYPSVHTPNHSHTRPQVARTENNFPKIAHTREPDLQTKTINGIHTYKEDIPRRQSPTFHYTDRRIHKDKKNNLSTKESNNHQEYIAFHGSHYVLPPHISTWLHDHEILEHIQSEKPASRSKTRSKNPSPSHGPRQTFVYRDTPTHMSRSTILELTEAPKLDKASILMSKKVTPHLTTRFKDDNITSYLKYTVKKNGVTSQPTSLSVRPYGENIESLRSTATLKEHEINAHPAGTRTADVKNNAIEYHSTLASKQDVLIPSTSSVVSKNLKEVYTTPHSELTTMNLNFLSHLGDTLESKSKTPKSDDQRTDAHTHLSYIQDAAVKSQKIYTDIKTNAPVLIDNKKTLILDTTRNIETFSPEHDTVPVPKDAPEEFITTQPQISQQKINVQIISSPKHDKTTNSQETLSSMETVVPVSITSEGFRIRELKTDIPPISSTEHEIAANTQEKYTSSELDTTDKLTENIKEPRVEDSTTVILTSSFFEHNIAANTSQIYNPEILYAQDLHTDVPVTMSPEHGRNSKIKKIVTASNVEESVTHIVMNASAQDIRTEPLVRDSTTATSDSREMYTHVSTDAPTLESYTRDPATDIPVTTSLENDTKLNTEEISIDVTTTTTTSPEHDTTAEAQDIVALTITDESGLDITTTDVPTFFKKSKTEDIKDILFNEYDRTTPFRIYAAKRSDGQAINSATESHPQDSVTDAPTKDDININNLERNANNTTTNPEERNSQTEVSTFLFMTSTESAESTKLEARTNSQNRNYSTSMNTLVLSTMAEPYSRDITINTSNIGHVVTDEYVLNETRELHIQNSQTNTPPTSPENDATTETEDLSTTTESPHESTERVTMPLSIKSSTEMSPASLVTPQSSTMLTPSPSPSPQNKTTEIDVGAAPKRRTCSRKKACGGTGKSAAKGKRRRRRRRRTTRAPQISYPTPAPGNT